MSKAVSISEGGKGRIFPQTDKLKINNVGGGNSLWLPEEEVVTGTLYADENGIYLAENDGFSCYDTVVVRVEDETDPDEEDWELDLDELDEDIWDEESLEEFQEDPEAFEEKFNDKEKWKSEKAKKEKSQKIKKVKSLKPSKITGIDPVDGNPYQVGVDSEGNLTKEMLPSSIHIVVPPWKREYENGEEINFYGMHVYLLDKDGHPFKTEQYPTGEIPFEELLLPVTIAEGGGEEEWHGGPGNKNATSELDTSPLTQPIPFGTGVVRKGTYTSGGRKWEHWTYMEGAEACIAYGSNNYVYLVASKNNTGYKQRTYAYTIDSGEPRENSSESQSGFGFNYTYNGKTVYYTLGTDSFSALNNVELYPTVEVNFYNSSNVNKIAWTLIYGDIESSDVNGIPVQWMRSDGEILEDQFSITVRGDSSSNSTENSSDSGSEHLSGDF